MIKQSWLESGGVYGYRKIHSDLRDMELVCGINRVHRLMKLTAFTAEFTIGKGELMTQGNEPGKHDIWLNVGAASCH